MHGNYIEYIYTRTRRMVCYIMDTV